MRSKNSKISAISAVLSNGIKILLSFFCQKLFLVYLGTKLLGLNGLFSNIISMLAITELGLGTAIIYNLYEPIAKNDKNKIKQLVNFYKKSYNIIIVLIILFSVCLVPFLKYFAGENINLLYIFYFLFIFDILLSYSVAYKSSLINAYQKNYVINMIHIIYLIMMYSLQMILLVFLKSYLIFLVVKLLSRLLENAFITIYYKKNYNWLNDVESKNLDKETKDDIISKVKALIYHKLSNFLVAGTDNLIISRLFGLVTVGLYANYCMIINSIQTLFQQMFSSIISSIGNLLIENDKKKSYEVYKSTLLLNFLIISFCTLSLYFMVEPFVSLWIGREYLLDNKVLLVLVFVFYSTGMRNAPNVFKNAAGIFVEDKYIPLVESLFNLVFSIILGIKFGLIGVFLGTFISTLVLHLYSYPKFLYGKLFERKKIGYVKEQFSLFFILIIEFIITYCVINSISINQDMHKLLFNALICIIVPNVINIVLFYRTNSFKYLINTFIKK